MQKHGGPSAIRFHKVPKQNSPGKHYLKLLQLYICLGEMRVSWNKTGRAMKIDIEVEGNILCNKKKHDSYLDADYEELLDFDFAQSDEEEGKS